MKNGVAVVLTVATLAAVAGCEPAPPPESTPTATVSAGPGSASSALRNGPAGRLAAAAGRPSP